MLLEVFAGGSAAPRPPCFHSFVNPLLQPVRLEVFAAGRAVPRTPLLFKKIEKLCERSVTYAPWGFCWGRAAPQTPLLFKKIETHAANAH